MKVQLADIVAAPAAIKGLLGADKIGARMSLTLGVVLRQLDPALREFEAQRIAVSRKHAWPKDGDDFTFSPDIPEGAGEEEKGALRKEARLRIARANRELEELIAGTEIEIGIGRIKFSHVEDEEKRGVAFKGEHIAALAWLWEE